MQRLLPRSCQPRGMQLLMALLRRWVLELGVHNRVLRRVMGHKALRVHVMLAAIAVLRLLTPLLLLKLLKLLLLKLLQLLLLLLTPLLLLLLKHFEIQLVAHCRLRRQMPHIQA